MLFQLPILLPHKSPARSSKPVFLIALFFQRLKAFWLLFPDLSAIFEQEKGKNRLGVKLPHIIYEG